MQAPSGSLILASHHIVESIHHSKMAHEDAIRPTSVSISWLVVISRKPSGGDSMKIDPSQYGKREAKHPLETALKGAFKTPPTPMKDIPSKRTRAQEKDHIKS